MFLHYVLDQWFDQEVRPRLKGEAFLIRYADDFVIGVAREDDAQRIMEVLPKRMSKYGLTVHPEKTRLIRFHPDESNDSEAGARDSSSPTTFDFLGFTHYWGRPARRMGGQTEDGEQPNQACVSDVSEWCRKNLHAPIKDSTRSSCKN